MARVNIYTREADDEVWEWARWQAGEDRHSLARIVADALRAYRAEREKTTAAAEAER